jgi:hypothetical protein
MAPLLFLNAPLPFAALSRRLGWLLLWFCLALSALPGRAENSSHPRLLITTNDLPRLRSWAVDTNPIYANGLALLSANAKLLMDQVDTNLTPPNPDVPYGDGGSDGYESFPTEQYAELFAFMSLLSTNSADRDDYARRATNLLMFAMNQAVLGPDTNEPPAPFRAPQFYTYDRNRPRWYGEGWALTVDWIYPYLSGTDKATVRKVFLQWSDEIVTNAYAAPPTPVGLTNDPTLLVNPPTLYGSPFNPVRWSGNNYFTAHMRNLGLLTMAFDAADDPGNQLRNHLSAATGGFLYIVDYLLRHDCRGGLLPEGFEYSPQTAAYITQFLVALHTAGQDNPLIYGPQVVLTNQPFWSDFIHAYLNSVSPATGFDPDAGVSFNYAAWYGDGQRIRAGDFIHCFGALGIAAASQGDTNRLNAVRWIEQNLPPGGPDGFLSRAGVDVNGDSSVFTDNILYFMLFDPAAPPPTDPHSTEPLDFFVPGMGRILSRTGWDTNAAWFTYKLSWSHIDHQQEDGNQFELFRRGEWLTSERTGYDLDYGSSDNHNTLALENDPVTQNDYRELLYLRGSQWGNLAGGDPQIVSYSLHTNYVVVTGDATPLYNSIAVNSADILHASRSLVWLKPDHIIVYDRAASKTAGRFKRFWLNTTTNGVVVNQRAAVTMASGQQLFLTSLLPTNAVVTSEPYTNSSELYTNIDNYGFMAELESMLYRLRVEAPAGPANVRFLNVIQGADPGANPSSAILLQSTNGPEFAGVLVANTAIFFPVNLYVPVTNLTYYVLGHPALHLVTGLPANSAYTVTRTTVGSGEVLSISAGGPTLTDSGGVLAIESPLLLTVQLTTSSDLLLTVLGAAGRTIIIQSSTNLTTWTSLGPATNALHGQLQFDDHLVPSPRARFYRALAD